MLNAVEYNKTAISDVKETLLQIMNGEQTQLVIETSNAGDFKDKIDIYAELYNFFSTNIFELIQQTKIMLENVLNSVNEVDEGQ